MAIERGFLHAIYFAEKWRGDRGKKGEKRGAKGKKKRR